MNIRTVIEKALSEARGEPAQDIYKLLLQKDTEIGPGNGGLLWAYIMEVNEALVALAQDIEMEAARRDDRADHLPPLYTIRSEQ